MKKYTLIVIMAMVTGGCVAGKVTYIPPTDVYQTTNSISVNKSRSDVWKQIIPSLGNSFFVINNLDKESGFINISYTGNPQKYVDCGVIKSYVSNAHGERNYSFPGSIAYKEYETMHNGQYSFMRRKMNLEGRVNIIVQEASANNTLVTVNIKYVLTKDINGTDARGRTHRWLDTVSFNTNGSASFPQPTTCSATGALEQEVLSALGL
jgi:hypothetical protein